MRLCHYERVCALPHPGAYQNDFGDAESRCWAIISNTENIMWENIFCHGFSCSIHSYSILRIRRIYALEEFALQVRSLTSRSDWSPGTTLLWPVRKQATQSPWRTGQFRMIKNDPAKPATLVENSLTVWFFSGFWALEPPWIFCYIVLATIVASSTLGNWSPDINAWKFTRTASHWSYLDRPHAVPKPMDTKTSCFSASSWKC